MNMILFYFHRIYFKLIPVCNLVKYLFEPLRQTTLQYQLAILGNPNQMILEIIDSMPATFNRADAQRISCFLAFGEPVFIHPASWVVFNRHFL